MNQKSLAKTLHILSAGLWLGASACVVLLQCLNGWSDQAGELLLLNGYFSILDFALIIPGAVGSLLTGFWICKTTSWGFTRYRWVIAKWVATAWGILVGSLLLGPWQIQMANLSSQPGTALVSASAYRLVRAGFTLVGAAQVLLLILIISISVRKPWGRCSPKEKEDRTVEPRSDLRLGAGGILQSPLEGEANE